MYEEHFGLNELPFQLTPDTDYFFAYRAHQEALNVLLVTLAAGEGFIKVTGEVGTGKTLLCRKLLAIAGRDMITAWLPNPFLNPNALRQALAEELGIDAPRNIGQHRLLRKINERLIEAAATGQRIVVCVDEAQSMPDDTLEALRLLSNLETEKHKLMSVVMFGQPELDIRLRGNRLRQLRSRIAFSYRLEPLDAAGVRAYLVHRLEVAGCSRAVEIFSNHALSCLHAASRGIPRLVNILAHKSLLAAFGEGRVCISTGHVLRAVADTEDADAIPRLSLHRLAAMLSRVSPLLAAMTVLGGAA